MNDNSQIFTLSAPITWREQETKGGKKFITEGYISTSDPDLVDDIVSRKCLESMATQMSQRVIKIDFEHESMIGKTDIERALNRTKMPLAKMTPIGVDEIGLKMRAEYNPMWKKVDDTGKITHEFKDIWTSIKSGHYDSYSIAYVPREVMNVIGPGGRTFRQLDDVILYNAALTGNAVNVNARNTAVIAKSIAFVMEQKAKNIDDNSSEVNKMTKENEGKLEVKDEGAVESVKTEAITKEAVVVESKPEEIVTEKVAENKVDVKPEQKSEVVDVNKLEVKALETKLVELKSVVEKQAEEIKALKAEGAKPVCKSVAIDTKKPETKDFNSFNDVFGKLYA